MKVLKNRLFIFAALMVVLIAAMGAFFGVGLAKADRTVTLNGNSIFLTNGDAKVWANTDGENEHYTMFSLAANDDTVTYKRNLAYKWFYNAENQSGEAVQADDTSAPSSLEKAEGYFNMEIGFERIYFKKYIITFEGQQYYQSKDGKSVNYIIFVPTEEYNVKVIITDDKDEEVAEDAISLNRNHIKIQFSEGENGGEYKVEVSSGAGSVVGAFKNVGGNFAKSSSSTTNPVTPLTFSAEFDEDGTRDARMAIYNLNGQSFKLTNAANAGDHYVGGTVNDDTPPVLCLDKGVSFIEEGEEISFNYTVIDVLTSSPSMTTAYFMLNKDQAGQTDFNASDCSDENLFATVKSDDDQYMIPHVHHYIPNSNDYKEGVFDNDNFKVTAAVKVYLKLTDTTATGGKTTYVLLDWYVDEDYLLTVNGNKYIAVATDKIGATYAYTDGTNPADPANNAEWQKIVEDYQAEVTKAAKDLKAGSKNYFYLPSFEKLLSDNATKYSDLTYTVFYNNGSQSSVSNKSASALSLTLSKAGEYVFTIYASDAAGNPMYYYDKDGEKVEFSGSTDVWNMYKDKDEEGLRDYLPWFRFNVGVSEISVEDPGEQKTAYVGSKFDSISFDINGVSYDTTYKLYRFENAMYYQENKNALTYNEFMETKEQLFKENRNLFTEIYALSDMNEEDDEYELYKDYEWNNSSLSFIPQDDNAFYLIVCSVTSKENGKQQDTAYMGISSSIKVNPINGEDTWLQDNLVSVILLSIGGAALIGLILLIFIKPKDKDVDAEFEAENKNSKKKSK